MGDGRPPDCPICEGPIVCPRHETCPDCGAAVEPTEQCSRGYAQSHENLNCETHKTFMAGAMAALGLLSMAQAIRDALDFREWEQHEADQRADEQARKERYDARMREEAEAWRYAEE